MGFIWRLIVGAVIGSFAGYLAKKEIPMGFIGNVIAGLVGSSLGESLLGTWGPSVAGMALAPSILGAVILIVVTSFVLSKLS